jgi:hypothetical protein
MLVTLRQRPAAKCLCTLATCCDDDDSVWQRERRRGRFSYAMTTRIRFFPACKRSIAECPEEEPHSCCPVKFVGCQSSDLSSLERLERATRKWSRLGNIAMKVLKLESCLTVINVISLKFPRHVFAVSTRFNDDSFVTMVVETSGSR